VSLGLRPVIHYSRFGKRGAAAKGAALLSVVGFSTPTPEHTASWAVRDRGAAFQLARMHLECSLHRKAVAHVPPTTLEFIQSDDLGIHSVICPFAPFLTAVSNPIRKEAL
jgi:hypothetical protein